MDRKKELMIGDFEVCVNEAQSFLHIADYCLEDTGAFLGGLMYPFAVNCSFSCELYLKAIMIKRSSTSEFQSGHDLKKLFEALDVSDQAQIKSIYEAKCDKPIEELLNESALAFQEWRYALEKGVRICVTGIHELAIALSVYVEKI